MFLGVDGGGTKTALCLIDRDGRVRAETRTGSVYYLMDGIDIVEPLLRAGVDVVCRLAGIAPSAIAYAFLGLPAYGEVSADVPTLDALPGRILGHDRYRCGNDMVCGWAGSLGGTDGISVVAGTGSIAYGQNDGRRWRGGGWGEVFGDEGSGYWVAIRGLNAFSRMIDGRLPTGPLVPVFRDALAISDDLDAIDVVINRWHGDRGRIATLSTAVAAAADAGDVVAAGLLTEAGHELALLVEVGADALDYRSDQQIPVSYSGGMFACPPVLTAFTAALNEPRYDLRTPLLPPHLGAALHAARLAGHPLDVAQVRRQLQEGDQR